MQVFCKIPEPHSFKADKARNFDTLASEFAKARENFFQICS